MTQWYVAVSGRQYGPVDEESLGLWVRQGRVTSDSYVWTEGMAQWLPLSAVPDLAGRVGLGKQPPMLPMRAHRGPLILVLGLVGMICCCTVPLGVVTGVIALVLGAQDLRAMERGQMDPQGRGMVIAGMIFGAISILLGLAAGIGFVFPQHFHWQPRRLHRIGPMI